MAQTIAIERVDHIGIRVRDLDRALAFYQVLGFALAHRAVGDDVAIIRNEHGVELNLVFNANAGDPASNILMDVPDKFPGYTHIALRVASIPATIASLRANGMAAGANSATCTAADLINARPTNGACDVLRTGRNASAT